METIYKGTYYDGLIIKTKVEDGISADGVRLFDPITRTTIHLHRESQSDPVDGVVVTTWHFVSEDTRDVPESVYALEVMQRVVANGNDQWKMLSYTPSFAKIVKSSEGV